VSRTSALRGRLEHDRLLRYSLLALLPALWLALALADPWLLLLAPLAAGLVAALFRYGPLERFEEPDELL